MELFRPISTLEYDQVKDKDFRAFPPRGAQQQLFTALLSEEGACDIARRMRLTKHEGETVYVVGFNVDDAYIRQFPVQLAESQSRRALWIPSEELEILNQHIIGGIRVLASYHVSRGEGELFFA